MCTVVQAEYSNGEVVISHLTALCDAGGTVEVLTAAVVVAVVPVAAVGAANC